MTGAVGQLDNSGPFEVVCVGAHILDVLGRPVTEIPAGQGGARLEQIRLTAAGTAAATAVDLARLGVRVASVGCIGTDEVGDLLLALMDRHGVHTAGVQRTEAAQTSATILPIRPNGERPALHVVGANRHFRADAVDPSLFADAPLVHLGGLDTTGAFLRDDALTFAAELRRRGCRLSLDLLGARPSSVAASLRPLLAHIDWLCPNEEQLCDLYGVDDPADAARAALDDGVGAVVVSLGADGCLVMTADGATGVPARQVDVVDTTGCGDAFSAGLVAGLLQGRDVVGAAQLGVVAGTLAATGLGSDAGLTDLPALLRAEQNLTERVPARLFSRR